MSIVGRTPWSAADAPVGPREPMGVLRQWNNGSGGTRADLGVCPTIFGLGAL
jgi:hypothetical protein